MVGKQSRKTEEEEKSLDSKCNISASQKYAVATQLITIYLVFVFNNIFCRKYDQRSSLSGGMEAMMVDFVCCC